MRPQRHVVAIGFCLIPTLVLVACSGASPTLLAEQRPGMLLAAQTAPPKASFTSLSEYIGRCPEDKEPSLECEWLRGLVVAELVETLEVVERSRDRRGVGAAMAALDLATEPEVLVAACRVLGYFLETPGIKEKVTPLFLESPYLQVQQMAASLLERVPDRTLAEVASQWKSNHGGMVSNDPFEGIGFPANYDAMSFPKYAGMERCTPADSDRSVGWWSRDEASVVARQLERALGVKSLSYQDWAARMSQQAVGVMQSIDPRKLDEITKLTEQYMKAPNQQLLEKIQALQQQLTAPLDQALTDDRKSVVSVATPVLTGGEVDRVFYLVAAEKAGHISRLVLVYRQAALNRTVIQMAWDLRDYPSAWGSGEVR